LNNQTYAMKKLILTAPFLIALNGFSQNLIQSNISNYNLNNLQAQSVQVFASNVSINDNNTNKPVRANSNPVVQTVQRASTAAGNQHRQRRRNPAPNISNPVQTNIINVSDKNINDDIQVQIKFVQQLDNNLGNAFGNESNVIEQIASLDIPAIQLGSGNMDLNLDINLPKINLKPIKLSGKGSSVSSSKHHKSFHLKNKLAKFNRKTVSKLSFKKKLKIRVDNCFKW
jgi:hypothetical protein